MRRTLGIIIGAALAVSACSSGDDETGAAPDSSTSADASDTASTEAPQGDGTDTDEPAGSDAEPQIVASLAEGADANLEAWSGSPTTAAFVRPLYATGEPDPETAAYAYLTAFADEYGVADVDARFETLSITETAAGTIVRVAQTLDGTPVFAGQLTLAVDATGTITRVTGVVVPDAELPATVITAEEARAAAEAETGLAPSPTDAPRLVVYSPAVEALDTAPPVPAWHVIVIDADQLESEVLVNALDGTILLVAGLDATEDWDLYDNANRVDDEGVSKLGEADLTFEARDGVITPQVDNPHADAVAVSNNFTASWNYFFDSHGRDSYDDAGGLCTVYVRVGVNWKNASAGRNCVIRFGDAAPYAQSLDVSAHEFTHAITRVTSGLVYENESGALNEHYSDTFAAMVDTSDWAITPTSRRMNRQSHISGYVETDSDKGGVHTNSQIGNTVVALLGSEQNLANNDIFVQGIGRPKTAQIWYATLLSLGPRTGYYPWACATIFTARDMVGSLLEESDVDEVIEAMRSVGLVYILNDELSCDQRGIVIGTTTPPEDPAPLATDPDSPPPSTAPPTTVPDTTTTTTTTVPDECGLVGVWRLRDQEFFDQIAAATGTGAAITYESGNYFFDINADGTAVGRRDAWSFRVASAEGDLITEITSTDPGTWSADGSILDFVAGSGEATVKLWIDAGGQLISLPAQNVEPQDAIGGSAEYTCEGDVLRTVEVETGMFSTFDRVD